MQIPYKISFHHMDPSPALETRIKEKINKLQSRSPNIIRCEVRVEASPHHRHKGNPYSVHILLTLPGKEMVVSHHSGRSPIRHEKIFAAMNDAFLAIEKKLKQAKQELRRDVKEHISVMQTGFVSMIDVADEYGFIIMEDDTPLYFHKNAVHDNKFSELALGSRVRYSFIEGEGVNGPQANYVRLLKNRAPF